MNYLLRSIKSLNRDLSCVLVAHCTIKNPQCKKLNNLKNVIESDSKKVGLCFL